MRAMLVILAAAALLLAAAAADARAGAATEASGVPRVLSGDQFEIGGRPYRLFGIAALRPGQTCSAPDDPVWACGDAAVAALRRLIEGRRLRCEVRGLDLREQVVASCRRDGVDVAAYMVRNGWALARRDEADDYVADEARARAAHAGAWRGRFVAPWDWPEAHWPEAPGRPGDR